MLDQATEQKVVETYLAGASTNEVVERTGVRIFTVRKVLLARGVMRTDAKVRSQNRHWTGKLAPLDVDVPLGDEDRQPFIRPWFSMTPERAYLYGFIAADGCLKTVRRETLVRIAVAEKDADIIEKLHALFGGNVCVQGPSGRAVQRQHVLDLRDGLYDELCRWGFCERKDFTLPYIVAPKGFERHFVRGLVDGDGSLRFISGKQPRMDFGNRNAQLLRIASVTINAATGVDGQIAVGSNREYPGHMYSSVYWSSQVSTAAARWLYLAEPCLCLDRKLALAQKFQDYYADMN